MAMLAGAQTQGTRAYQEDAWQAVDFENGSKLIILADGMGGHAGGALAAEIAVKVFVSSFQESWGQNESLGQTLHGSLLDANEAIKKKQLQDIRYQSMGTTLVSAFVFDNLVSWVSVGDSPLWLLGRKGIRRLNENHSVAYLLDQMVDAGKITLKEAERGNRNALRSALTGDQISLIDLKVNSIKIDIDDTLVLASDGVESLSQDRLVEILGDKIMSPADKASKVVASVDDLRNQNQDNATVVLYSER